MKAQLRTKPHGKAISYKRWSSTQQGQDGRDSLNRQTNAFTDACAKWSLEPDGEYVDPGKSGYHARHLKQGGAMHKLVEMAKAGLLKGRTLVVEDFT
jgi:DNA invertase Pin-like site-specific DNA recombinase